MEVKVNSSKLIYILVEAQKRAGKPFSLNSWFKNPFSPIIMLVCSHRSLSCDFFLNDPDILVFLLNSMKTTSVRSREHFNEGSN